MQQYSNLVEAINGLREEGYTEDFNLQQHCLECRDRQYQIFHDEFVVDKYFRFDVSSDAADQSIIYAISSEKYRLKGILINAYGIYNNQRVVTARSGSLEPRRKYPVQVRETGSNC